MKIELDLNELEKLKLSPNQYVALYKLYKKTKTSLPSESIQHLVNLGYLKNKKITDKTIELFNNSTKLISSEKAKEICKNYVNLFPKGVKTAGYPVKSTVDSSMIRKMQLFIKNYAFSEEEIFAATKKYIDEKKRDGYSHMMLSKYFIEKKGGGSMLADYCQYMRDNPEEIHKTLSSITDFNIKTKF